MIIGFLKHVKQVVLSRCGITDNSVADNEGGPSRGKHRLSVKLGVVVGICVALASCKMLSERSLQRLATAKDPDKMVSQLWREQKAHYKNNPDALFNDIASAIKFIKAFQQETEKTWGKDNGEISSQKQVVKYTDNLLSRSKVDFQSGQVIVETLAKKQPKAHLETAIITTLLTPDDPNGMELFSSNTPKFNAKPYLYGQVLDHQRKPIAYQWRAQQYAKYLVKNAYVTERNGDNVIHRVSFKLEPNHTQLRKTKFKPYVDAAAKRYGVDPALIYAIIETESSFNPVAVSHAPAFGLMQVVPKTAGRDVFQRQGRKQTQPTPTQLFNPKENIEIGTAYLQILDEIYLKNIRPPLSREYAVIAAYNGGAGNLFKTFSSGRDSAVRQINKLSSDAVYWKIKTQHPKAESRRYLVKVTTAKKHYK